MHFNRIKLFIRKTALFSSIFVLIVISALIISSKVVNSRGFNNYNTESNTLFLKENEQYDILIMGISHARNFSRHKNHLRVEKILNSKIVNIAQGKGACGVNEQLFYLDYFYKERNKTSTIIFVLSPPMLFSETLPIATNTFNSEKFDLSFIKNYLDFESENKNGRIISYLQSKLKLDWILKKPSTKDKMNISLDSLNETIVTAGQNMAYSGSELNYNRFQKSIKKVEEIIRIAKNKNSKMILLMPPALFGKWRGHEETLSFAESMVGKYSNVIVFDGSESVLEPKFYYDNHHLNTKGVVYFTENYLKKIIEESKAH